MLIVDNVMPELNGLDLIREIVASTPEGERPQILMMTAHATVESAIEAMKLGALDYLQKPFEIDELLVVVRRALDHQRLRTDYRYLVSERDEQFDHYGIIGRSRAMEEVIRRAELVAETKSTVLIMGETGTGKELVARAIHDRSAQRDMPLIKVNCAAIPETLLESELFGHVRGAFTGATTTKKGKFALADGGTIFLDEIGTMSPTLQSKLLRVLQEREVEPLGSERTEKIDVRVIAATNRDLRQMVADGKFREDLFYRLNVIPIEIPPLRERRDDIPALVEHFVQKHAQRTGRRFDKIDDGGADRAAAVRLAGQRPRAGEHDRARGGALAGPGDHRPGGVGAGRRDAAGDRAAVAEAAAEHRVGRARDDPARARELRRRQEGRRRADGHQPARAVVLPGEVPARIVETCPAMEHRHSHAEPEELLCAARPPAIAFAAALSCGGSSSPSTGPSGTCTPSTNPNTLVIMNNSICPQTLTVSARHAADDHNQDARDPRDDVRPASRAYRLPGAEPDRHSSTPARAASSGNLNTARRCGIHDHINPGSASLKATITIQ